LPVRWLWRQDTRLTQISRLVVW